MEGGERGTRGVGTTDWYVDFKSTSFSDFLLEREL
jgi:hypothetical protein